MADRELVFSHVQKNAAAMMKQPSGELVHPYLVPSGPYNQIWCWDSMLAGVGLLPFSAAEHLAGSMISYFERTDLANGAVPGCLTPNGPRPTLLHAKPVIIQGALFAAAATNDFERYRRYRPAMEALLRYWAGRRDAATQLHVWHDMMESGADNIPLAPNMSKTHYSPKEEESSEPKRCIASPDLATWLFREHSAFAVFCERWAEKAADAELRSLAARHRAVAKEIADTANKFLWDEQEGYYVAYNVKQQAPVRVRTFLLAFPLLAGRGFVSEERAARCVSALMKDDMLSPFGVRSLSSLDPNFNNENIIVPYSNWAGPVWPGPGNCTLVYALASFGFLDQAKTIADRTVAVLARAQREHGQWHECYNSVTGEGLAAPGFLSWNVLVATLHENLERGVNPFAIPPTTPS